MSFQDRHYERGGGQGHDGAGGDLMRRVVAALNWSFPIGTYLDVRVRVHVTFLVLVAFRLLSDGSLIWTLRWTTLLFLSVLLHEFGHCLACRHVGGRANDILMWPLGGLAFCEAPRRPWAEFVTVVWGPMVNLIIAASCYTALWVMYGVDVPVSLNPFVMWLGFTANVPGLIADLYVVNYALFLFNMCLVFFPFDAGRLIQVALWVRLGYLKSMRIACRVGLVGAVLIALLGLAFSNLLLILIGAFGFYTSYQQGQYLKYAEAEEQEAWDVGYYNERELEQRQGPITRWRQRRADKAARRRAAVVAHRHAEVDRILAKVKDQGMASLTAREKKALQRATDEKRRAG